MVPSRLVHRHLINVVRPTLVRTAPALLNQNRPFSVESLPSSEASSIVAAQRKNRPISPHLSIYQPQIPWYLSALNRITGAFLSGGVYLFGTAYLVSPYFGWHLDVPTMTAAFGALPVAAKFGIKTVIAAPFAFHSINGFRHLIWDSELKNKQVIRTGWTVIGLTAVTTLTLASM